MTALGVLAITGWNECLAPFRALLRGAGEKLLGSSMTYRLAQGLVFDDVGVGAAHGGSCDHSSLHQERGRVQ